MPTNRIYKTGGSCRYGNLVAVSDQLKERSKQDFYFLLNHSIKRHKLTKEEQRQAKLIKNLKKGVSVGSDYFLIKDLL